MEENQRTNLNSELESKQKIKELENTDQVHLRQFLLRKYLIELAFMFIILVAIVFARCKDLIDTCVTGTLLGAVIGYFASDIRKIHT
jgi:hypothetical protein